MTVGFTNVKKTIEWMINRKSVQETLTLTNLCIVVYFYVDLFPWLAWSRFFNAETTIRLKILEEQNLYNFVVTLGSWLGNDKADHVANLEKCVFDQLKELDTVHCEALDKDIKVS